MREALQALGVVLPVLYLGVALLLTMELAGPRAPRPRRIRWGLTALLIGVDLAWFGCLWDIAGHFPVANAFVSLALLALALLIITLVVELFARTPATGSLVVGTAFLIQLVSSMFVKPQVTSPLAGSPFFVIHVVTIIFAVAAILLSGFYGALYLVLLREIRSKRFGFVFSSLPNLDTLSKMNRGSASAGFLLMTLGLNLGIWWAHSSDIEGFSYLDPKVLTVMALWLIFGLIGLSRWVSVLSGRRAALVAVWGLALVVVSFLVSLLGPSFHNFSR